MQWKLLVAFDADITGCLSMFELNKILKFTNRDKKELAEKTLRMHKVQISEEIDAQGGKFVQYSQPYAKRKKGGSRRPVTLKDTGKMLQAFRVLKSNYKGKEIKFKYGTRANKQGIKMNEHNDGIGKLPVRKIAEDNALGPMVEKSIAQNFARQISKNLSRITKTKYKVTIG